MCTEALITALFTSCIEREREKKTSERHKKGACERETPREREESLYQVTRIRRNLPSCLKAFNSPLSGTWHKARRREEVGRKGEREGVREEGGSEKSPSSSSPSRCYRSRKSEAQVHRCTREKERESPFANRYKKKTSVWSHSSRASTAAGIRSKVTFGRRGGRRANRYRSWRTSLTARKKSEKLWPFPKPTTHSRLYAFFSFSSMLLLLLLFLLLEERERERERERDPPVARGN